LTVWLDATQSVVDSTSVMAIDVAAAVPQQRALLVHFVVRRHTPRYCHKLRQAVHKRQRVDHQRRQHLHNTIATHMAMSIWRAGSY
jgi:hypothetical protein